MIKKLILNFLWKHGYDIQTTEYTGKSTTLTRQLLKEINADVLIDVGANEGQFAKEVLAYNKTVPIVSFEPLSSAHNKLISSAKKHSNWIIAPRMAISSKNGAAEINISNNSVSSSLMQIENKCTAAAPGASYISKEKVEVKKLDDAFKQDLSKYNNLYLKLDVQGSEKDVLEGAKEVLKKTKALQIEMSVVKLYKDEMLLKDWLDYIDQLGFHLYAFSNGFRDPATKELLQCDGFFIRR